MKLSATVASVQVGMPQTVAFDVFDGSLGKPLETGFIKRPVSDSVWLGSLGFDGDGQADLVHHGGPDKAVCAYPLAHYPFWRDELSLPVVGPGSFGENLTLAELEETQVCIGDTWKMGEAVLQVSQPRQPCWKLARRWGVKDLALRVQRNGKTGWYFRVFMEGMIETGMALTLVDRPHQDWTIAAANRIMHLDKTDLDGATQLESLAELSGSWKDTLRNRIEKNQSPDHRQRLKGLE